MGRIINRTVIGATLLGLIGCVHWEPIKRDYEVAKTNSIEQVSSAEYGDRGSVKVTRPLACPIEVDGRRYLLDLNMGQVRTGLRVEFNIQPDEEEFVNGHVYSRSAVTDTLSEAARDKIANEGHR